MSRLLNYFLRGLVVVVPLALTVYVCVVIFTTIDSWLGLPIRGVGFLLMIVLVTLVGFLTSSILTRSLLAAVDRLFDRLPFVRLLYSSAKDMLNAFVGEKRRFDKPVLVSVSDDRAVKVLAFLTSDSLASLGAIDHVAVYMPQSYGLAGHILVVPADRIQRINADAAEVMAFIISGASRRWKRGPRLTEPIGYASSKPPPSTRSPGLGMPQSGGEKKDEAKGSDAGPQVGTRYSADEIHENVVTAAEDEMERGALELAFSGVASGLVIGFTFLATAFLTPKVSPANRPVAAGIAYPLGFIFVVLGRHQLFTENTLEPVVPVLERRTLRSLRKLLRLWSIVLAANLIGAAVFALAVAWTPVLEPSLNGALLDVARTATSGSALLVFYKAIWAGWLVATMAWLIASTRDTTAQIALVWLTTAPIAALGFKHSIAGAVDVFYRIWLGDVGFGTGILGFEIPALAGNIVGGVVLVALVNHGQVGKGS